VLNFTKSHGLGNDYLVIDVAVGDFAPDSAAVRRLCDRHTGVGADGILLPMAAPGADFGVRILNSNGSEAEKSGNGLRIFGKFLYDRGYTRRRNFTVATLGGVVHVQLLPDDGPVTAVRVEMGVAVCDLSLLPIAVKDRTYEVTPVSMGNPHTVALVGDLGDVDLHVVGPLVETHPAFPKRTNVQFATVRSRSLVETLIWERGAGHTLASGSSACVVACVVRGLVDGSVIVRMEGGDLEIEVGPELEVILTGSVEEICVGSLSAEFASSLLVG
jgi:diaminopimelate epimerase